MKIPISFMKIGGADLLNFYSTIIVIRSEALKLTKAIIFY